MSGVFTQDKGYLHNVRGIYTGLEIWGNLHRVRGIYTGWGVCVGVFTQHDESEAFTQHEGLRVFTQSELSGVFTQCEGSVVFTQVEGSGVFTEGGRSVIFTQVSGQGLLCRVRCIYTWWGVGYKIYTGLWVFMPGQCSGHLYRVRGIYMVWIIFCCFR